MDVDRETLLQASRFRIERLVYENDHGKQQREVIRHPGAVTIIPMVSRDRVCLIRQHRVTVDKTLIELPAGTLEEGEAPLSTAERELIEETGYRAGKIEPMAEFFLSPGILDERMHLFLATDLTEGPTAREDSEQIENWVVDWSEAMALVRRGAIEDAKSLVGLLLYDQRRSSHSGVDEGESI